jgi:arginase family enzyme
MIKVIGIPFDNNSSFLRGSSLAPPLVRLMDKNGSANCFAENGIEIIEGENYKDEGDIIFDTSNAAIAFNVIKNTIAKELAHNNKCCCIGGDHSISYPVIDAFTDVYSNLHVLHLDAHADLYENFDNNHRLYCHSNFVYY